MFNKYFENGFDTTDDGEIIFSPFGNLGKSYILPGQGQKQIIKHWNIRFLFFSFVFAVFFPMVNMIVFDSLYIERELKSDLSLCVTILFTILYLFCVNHVYKKRLSRFDCITRKFSFRGVAEKNAQSMSYVRFIASEIFLLFFLAMSATASFLFPKDPHIGNRPTLLIQIFMICLFVICLIAFVWFLYLLMIKVRTHFKDKS